MAGSIHCKRDTGVSPVLNVHESERTVLTKLNPPSMGETPVSRISVMPESDKQQHIRTTTPAETEAFARRLVSAVLRRGAI